MEFYINKKKSQNILYTYYGILAVFVLVLLFSSGVVTSTVSLKGIVISSISIVILVIVLIKANLARKDTSPLIRLDPEGIISRTTPMSKAAGLIRWQDITGIRLDEMPGDTLVALSLENAAHYTEVLRKKMPAFALKGTVDENNILTLNLSASELDFDAQALLDHIQTYAAREVKSAIRF